MRIKLLAQLFLPLALVTFQQGANATPGSRLAQIEPHAVMHTPTGVAPQQLVKNGLVTSKLAKNGVIDYFYANGRVSKIVGPRGSWKIDVLYKPSGELDQMVRSNGAIDKPVFNADGTLKGLQNATGQTLTFTGIRVVTTNTAPAKSGERAGADRGRSAKMSTAAGAPPADALIVKDTNAKLIDGVYEADSMACQVMPDGTTECYEWPGGGGGDDGGGGGGGGGVYDPGPGNESPPPGGGGDEGVGGGGGGPPGTAPGDSPARAECMANAYIALNTMLDYVCAKTSTPANYASCRATAMRLYAEEVTYCNTIP